MLNDLNIKLIGRKLWKPPKSGKEYLNLLDRNPREGKFGKGKKRYGLGLRKVILQVKIKNPGVSELACIKIRKDGQVWRLINFFRF